MKKKLRVVAVGAGYFGQFHLRAWQRLDDAELIGIVENDVSAHASLQQNYTDVKIFETLQDALTSDSGSVDIIDIITPPASHLTLIEQVCACCVKAQTGCTIICQKPFCESLSQAQLAVAQAEQHNQTLIVHENFRFQPWYKQIKAIIDEGRLGTIYNAQFKLRPGDGQGPDAYLDRQPYFRDMPKFMIHETGIHWVDVFRFLFGEPCAVYADLQKLNPVISGEDTGYFVFHYPSGLRAHFDGNRLLDHAAGNTRLTLGTLLIEGSEASLSLDGYGQIHLRKRGEPASQQHRYHFDDTDFGGDCVYLLQQHVVEHLVNDAPVQNTAAAYLVNIELETAIYESAASQSLRVI